MITRADLCRIDLFRDLDAGALERLAGETIERELEPGEWLKRVGDSPTAFILLFEGEVEGVVQQPGGTVERDKFHVAPTWMGAIPLLTESRWNAGMRAWTRCRAGEIPAQAFLDLLHRERSVELAVMRTFQPVFQRVQSTVNQREKLAALGTMAAGLAHELNNPAAAARRSAEELGQALEVVQSTLAVFVESGVERGEAEQLVGLQREAVARAAAAERADPLDAAEREDALAALLERLGIEGAWALAEPLAAAGVDTPWLERVGELAGPATEAAVRWVAATLTAQTLVADLQDSTARISGLVGAVKQYAYMDRGELQEVDVHQGLDSTLTILGHKLRRGDVTVRREYDRSVPAIEAYGSELNQVWTNLLDNAIDAVAGDGTVTIRTGPDRDGGVVVEIADDGPGLPADVRDRLFEPFFTTKDVGEGTGLGLDTARRIVVDRHHGRLELEDTGSGALARVTLPRDGHGAG